LKAIKVSGFVLSAIYANTKFAVIKNNALILRFSFSIPKLEVKPKAQ